MLEKIVRYRVVTVTVFAMLLLLVSYRFSLRHTVEAYREQSALQKQLVNSDYSLVEPHYLQRKLDNMNRLVTAYKTDTTAFRSVTVNTIAMAAQRNGVHLTDVPVSAAGNTVDDRIITQRLLLKGSYFSLLKTYRELIHLDGSGYIRSASWRKPHRNGISATPGNDLILELYIAELK